MNVFFSNLLAQYIVLFKDYFSIWIITFILIDGEKCFLELITIIWNKYYILNICNGIVNVY